MSKLYNNIVSLCESRGITGYRMCKEIGIQPSILTDLKMGRKEGLSSKNADKIARYFGVSVSFLLGTEEERNIYITGNPGVGKSAIITQSFDELLQKKTKKPSVATEELIAKLLNDASNKAIVVMFGGDGPKVVEIPPEAEETVKRMLEAIDKKNTD